MNQKRNPHEGPSMGTPSSYLSKATGKIRRKILGSSIEGNSVSTESEVSHKNMSEFLLWIGTRKAQSWLMLALDWLRIGQISDLGEV